MADLERSEPIKVPAFVFPTPGVAIPEGSNKAKDQEHNSADPLGAILEKNVTETRDILEDQSLLADPKSAEHFNLSHKQTQQIHTLLKTRGMDSQQADHAIKEIRDIVEG